MCSQAPWLTPLICAPADKVQFSWLDSENGLNWCREQRSFHKKSWKLLYKSYKYLILKISLSIFQCLGSHLDKFLPENSLHAFFLNKEIEPSNKKKKKKTSLITADTMARTDTMAQWIAGVKEKEKVWNLMMKDIQSKNL